MGKRINLAALAEAPVLEAPVPRMRPAQPTTAPLTAVAPNPLNPRDNLGDLTELARSISTMGQLQPCTVVSRNAYLAQYPEHEATIGAAAYVAVTGGRRQAAAKLAELATLDIVLRDDLAASREALAAAAIAENIERRDFDVLEEARAVQMLVELCGSGTAAAERLARTKGWVSQRLALLRLSPTMQDLLRTGELPVRDARRLAQLDSAEQLPAWKAEQEVQKAERFTAVNRPEPTGEDADHSPTGPADLKPASTPRPRTEAASKAAPAPVVRVGDTPEAIAQALREYLDRASLQTLVQLLSTDL